MHAGGLSDNCILLDKAPGDSSGDEKERPPDGAEPASERQAPSVQLVPAPSAGLAAAVRRADEFRRHTKADATQAAYESDWRGFQTWAAAHGARTLPAAPEVVCAYLGWLAGEGYSVASMERFLSAGSYFHRAAGLDFPRGSHAVTETLKGIRRRVGVKRTKKAPLGLKALADVCERLQGSEELQHRALLTVGWFCMLRSANLVAIRREHVRLVRLEGDDWIDDDTRPGGLILHLPGSKTDQLKEGRDIAVHAQSDEAVCPVRALREHLRAGRFAPDALIFPISERTVSRLIKRLVANPEHRHKSLGEIAKCEACASAAHRFASHSLRRGSATAQAQKGVAERDIMRQGGWKNERVMRGYIEHATLFQNNPTKDLTGAVAAPAAPPCPHCAANGIKATLQAVTTARGSVMRCWQCGGEYRGGERVWPVQAAPTKRPKRRRSTRAFHGR